MGLFSHSCVTALRGPCWDLRSVPELTPLSRATGSREQSVSCAVRRQRHHQSCCVLGCSSHLTGSDLRGTVSVSTQNPATSPSLLRGMGVSITTSVITTPLTRLTSLLYSTVVPGHVQCRATELPCSKLCLAPLSEAEAKSSLGLTRPICC